MRKIIYGLVLLIPTFATSFAMADYTNCRWTVEGTNSYFKTQELYSQPPKMVAPAECNASSAGKPKADVKPTCIGQIYCEAPEGLTPPQILTVGCLATKVNGKWSCPTAATCSADQDVQIKGSRQIPAPAEAAAPRSQGGGTSQGMDGPSNNQGVGGR